MYIKLKKDTFDPKRGPMRGDNFARFACGSWECHALPHRKFAISQWNHFISLHSDVAVSMLCFLSEFTLTGSHKSSGTLKLQTLK